MAALRRAEPGAGQRRGRGVARARQRAKRTSYVASSRRSQVRSPPRPPRPPPRAGGRPRPERLALRAAGRGHGGRQLQTPPRGSPSAAPAGCPWGAGAAPGARRLRLRGLASESGYALHVTELPSSGRLFGGTPQGVAYDISKEWASRVAKSGNDIVFQKPGSTDNADVIRFMDPTSKCPKAHVRAHIQYGQPATCMVSPAQKQRRTLRATMQGRSQVAILGRPEGRPPGSAVARPGR